MVGKSGHWNNGWMFVTTYLVKWSYLGRWHAIVGQKRASSVGKPIGKVTFLLGRTFLVYR
jgi:hypothetical protein